MGGTTALGATEGLVEGKEPRKETEGTIKEVGNRYVEGEQTK